MLNSFSTKFGTLQALDTKGTSVKGSVARC